MLFVNLASVLQRRTCMPGGGGARQVKVCDPAVDADAAAGALAVCIRKQPVTTTVMTPHKTLRSIERHLSVSGDLLMFNFCTAGCGQQTSRKKCFHCPGRGQCHGTQHDPSFLCTGRLP